MVLAHFLEIDEQNLCDQCLPRIDVCSSRGNVVRGEHDVVTIISFALTVKVWLKRKRDSIPIVGHAFVQHGRQKIGGKDGTTIIVDSNSTIVGDVDGPSNSSLSLLPTVITDIIVVGVVCDCGHIKRWLR